MLPELLIIACTSSYSNIYHIYLYLPIGWYGCYDDVLNASVVWTHTNIICGGWDIKNLLLILLTSVS